MGRFHCQLRDAPVGFARGVEMAMGSRRTYGVFLLDVELEVHRARASGCYAELGRNRLSVCVMDCRVLVTVAYAI